MAAQKRGCHMRIHSDGPAVGRDPGWLQIRGENTLLVWASDQAHIAPDFVAVIDFDRDSPTYGKVLRTVPLSGASAFGNEPHHVGLSRDGRTMALGGLLSVLRGQDQVFFFDVTDPRQPTFIRSDNPPSHPSPTSSPRSSNGGFLVTFMGGANGAQPGRVVEYDAGMAFVQTWPRDASRRTDSIRTASRSTKRTTSWSPVTSSARCARSMSTAATRRTSAAASGCGISRSRAIIRTIAVGDPARPAGTMEVQLIPRDQRLRAFTAGMADNKLYLVDTAEGTATAVFDFDVFSSPNAPAMPQLLRMNREGTRLFVTLNGAGKVVMFNIARPNHPELMSVVDLGAGSGPHFLRLTSDERRLVVTDYFLVEDLAPGGIVNVEGDHKIHVINVHGNRLELDRAFDVDFNRDISTRARTPARSGPPPRSGRVTLRETELGKPRSRGVQPSAPRSPLSRVRHAASSDRD